MKEIFITEIFNSFQGESTFVGRLTSFIRFSECNLACTLCDTKYSWNKTHKLNKTTLLNLLENLKTPYWCITGGEPLLQQEALSFLVQEANKRNIKTSVETNGSIKIIPDLKTKWILDVKTPSTGESKSFNKENFALIKKGDELKFLISTQEDFNFSKNFIITNKLLDKNINLLFSPNLETDMKQLLAKLIRDWGKDIIFQPQLHKLIPEKPVYILERSTNEILNY